MKRKSVRGLSGLVLLGGMALSACAGAPQQALPTDSPLIPTAGAAVEAAATQAIPVTGTGEAMLGAAEFDQSFIQMMVPHHQGAVAMAEVALERSQRPEIRQMADDIIETQQGEIDQMLGWMESWYGTREVPDMSAMPMLPGMESMGHGEHEVMDMAAEVEALRSAPEPFDLAFIDAMIEHHQSAIDAANAALANAQRAEIKAMAQAIIDAQQAEIDQMNAWKAEWSNQ